MESSHRGLRRRVATLALEVEVSKSETQGQLSGCEGAIGSHLVFSLPELAGQENLIIYITCFQGYCFHSSSFEAVITIIKMSVEKYRQ